MVEASKDSIEVWSLESPPLSIPLRWALEIWLKSALDDGDPCLSLLREALDFWPLKNNYYVIAPLLLGFTLSAFVYLPCWMSTSFESNLKLVLLMVFSLSVQGNLWVFGFSNLHDSRNSWCWTRTEFLYFNFMSVEKRKSGFCFMKERSFLIVVRLRLWISIIL